MDNSNIKISGLVSKLDKNENGYYTSNEIFDGQENISSRYSLKAGPSFTHYFIFSKRDGHKVCYLSMCLADKKFDYRDSNHIELFDMDIDVVPMFNDTAPKLMKAVCRETACFHTTETDMTEALFYLAPYIPEKLKERMIFSFDDKGKDNKVILLTESPKDDPKIEDFYEKYARRPQLYYELFNDKINDLYSKGYYKHGPMECLVKAVTKIDELEAEKNRRIEEDNRRRKEQEERERQRREEEQREKERQEEIKRQKEQQAMQCVEEEVFYNGMQRSIEPNGDVKLVPPKEVKKEKVYEENFLPERLYPDDRYAINYLCCNVLIDVLYKKHDPKRYSIIWENVVPEQIWEFTRYAKLFPKIIKYAEPESNSRFYGLYKSIYDYIVLDNKSNAALFLGLQLWLDQTSAFYECKQYGIDYKKAVEKFCEILIAEPTDDNQGFRQKIQVKKRNSKLKRKLESKIKKYKKGS